MNEKIYCPNCNKYCEVEIKNEIEVYPVKGEPIEVSAKVTYCKTCGMKIWNEDVDDANLVSAFNIYREKHHLLKPEEIKNIRKKYGLSQKLFAKILGFGEKTITRYENGSIQDAAQDNLMKLMKESRNFESILRGCENELSEKDLLSVSMRLDEMRHKSIPHPEMDYCNRNDPYYKFVVTQNDYTSPDRRIKYVG